ncbi:MAG TPA: sensor histidine kinase [Solirubrobacteraceae bacterium]|nr:sensor histidine kinase [Solirubrobacteraceae bacterium]
MPPSRWFGLFLITRATGALVVPPLLLVDHLDGNEFVLAGVALGYSAASAGVLARWPALQQSRSLWVADCAVLLSLVLAYGEWRSPFYLLALSSLVLPATGLSLRGAVAFGGGFVAAYLGVALLVGVDWASISTTARMQSFGALLLVPLVVTVALAFASDLLRRLERERQVAERLALEAERQRIAWELHDSAKQRIHAAHLLLSAVADAGPASRSLELAVEELRAAIEDMDTSLRDLREPLFDGGSLGAALRQWAERLQAGSDVRIEVVGDAPTLPAFTAAQAYRIGREALTNAVRHASASHAEVVLDVSGERLSLLVSDDGEGLPAEVRAGANGLASMQHRAEALGAELDVVTRPGGRGTIVALDAPLVEAAHV